MWRLILLTIAVAFSSQQTASAYGTVNFLGQAAEHEKITRLGLAKADIDPQTLNQIAGANWSFGAVGAPDRLDRGLISNSAAHCDNGDYLNARSYPQSRQAAARALADCRSWIFANIRLAIEHAARLAVDPARTEALNHREPISCVFNGRSASAKCKVIEHLGLAFHAAQDFYSHTNWSDRFAGRKLSALDPPGLGNRAPARWLNPRFRVRMPSGLISGCFAGIPESVFCRGRIRHSILNKDTGTISVDRGAIGAGSTKRGLMHHNFARSVRAAIQDTQDKWRYFEAQVLARHGHRQAKRIMCIIRRDTPLICR